MAVAPPDGYVLDQPSSGAPPEGYVLDEQPGKLESFTRGAANNFPLMPQGIATAESATGIGDEGGYSKNLADWNAKAQEAKEANPKTYGAGAVTGSLAPLAIPYVGEALEASPIAGNAALGAANAISNTDLTQDPLNTLKEAGIGAGIGGATAGVVGKMLPSQQGLESIATKKAVQSAEMPSGIVGAMSTSERVELGDFLQKSGLVGEDKSKVLEQARNLSKEFGDKIGEIADTTEGQGLHVDPNDHYQAMQGLLDKAQEFAGKKNLEMRKIARDLTNGADDILSLPANPSWTDIQKLKESYGKAAFDDKGGIKSEGAKETYFTLKDMLKGIVAKAQNNPNLGDEYKQALAGYSRMQPIESGLERAVDAELRGSGAGMGARGLAGVIRKLPGPVRAVAGPAAVAMGHPIVGLAAALPEMMDPAIQSKAASLGAKAVPAARQGMSQMINDYLISERKKKAEATQ